MCATKKERLILAVKRFLDYSMRKTCPYSHHRKTSVTSLSKETCHRSKKKQVQHAKSVGKELAMHENVLVTTMNLQAVLLSPSSKTAALYCKTKMCCHNFTLYMTWPSTKSKTTFGMKQMEVSQPMNLPPAYSTT